MQIAQINNVSFKSFLPSKSKVQEGDKTRDYWNDFARECSKDTFTKKCFDELLQELANNGDNNILALETTEGIKNDPRPKFYFRVYKNNEDLIADRKEVRGRDIGRKVSIRPMEKSYPQVTFIELEGQMPIGYGGKIRNSFLNEALLSCLSEIIRDPQKRMFAKPVDSLALVKQLRLKV